MYCAPWTYNRGQISFVSQDQESFGLAWNNSEAMDNAGQTLQRGPRRTNVIDGDKASYQLRCCPSKGAGFCAGQAPSDSAARILRRQTRQERPRIHPVQ